MSGSPASTTRRWTTRRRGLHACSVSSTAIGLTRDVSSSSVVAPGPSSPSSPAIRSLTGLDQSPEMLALAERKVPRARLIQGDMSSFSLGERFDVVICVFDSLNHLLTFDGLGIDVRRGVRPPQRRGAVHPRRQHGRRAPPPGRGAPLGVRVRRQHPDHGCFAGRRRLVAVGHPDLRARGESQYLLHHEEIGELGIGLARLRASLAKWFDAPRGGERRRRPSQPTTRSRPISPCAGRPARPSDGKGRPVRPAGAPVSQVGRYWTSTVTQALAPRPMTWASATWAPSTWRTPAVPRSCRTSSTTWPSAEAPSGSPFDSSPPDGLMGSRPPIRASPRARMAAWSPGAHSPSSAQASSSRAASVSWHSTTSTS